MKSGRYDGPMHAHTLSARQLGLYSLGLISLLALSADGWIVGANAIALLQLGLSQQDIGALQLEPVLGLSLAEVHGRAGQALATIVDDILDVEADTATLGKSAGKDQNQGKGTLVSRMGLDAAKAERDRLARNALEALANFGTEADMLRATALFIVKRGH